MPEPSSGNQSVRFGPYEADLTAGELRKNGIRLKLQEQPFQVLAALLERPGEVVTREELRQRLWADDTFVDFDNGLNTAINKIRDVLCDSARRPSLVETVPRRGYRWIGPAPSARRTTLPSISGSAERGKRGGSERRLLPAWIVGVVAVTLFLSLGARHYFGEVVVAPVRALAPVPLTSYPGEETQPTFSPDGSQVAFARRDTPVGDFDVWIKVVGQESSVRLTRGPADDMSPTWSPDGRWIAFLRLEPGGSSDVLLISPLGGLERKIAEIASDPVVRSTLQWSPDGGFLAVDERPAKDKPGGIVLIDPNSGYQRRLAGPDYPLSIAISPDSKRIAFFDRYNFEKNLQVVDVETGSFETIGTAQGWTAGLAWTPDGRRLVYSADHGLWTVAVSGGTPTPLRELGRSAMHPVMSSSTGRLAYSHETRRLAIWLLDTKDANPEFQPFVPSTYSNANPQFSPDNRHVAFFSRRSGQGTIWIADQGGSNLLKLTTMSNLGSPRWAPDGSDIVFNAASEGSTDIFAVSLSGGPPRRITINPAREVVPSYSTNGRWIYFASNRSGSYQVWKAPVQGEAGQSGSAIQVTKGGGFAAAESPDGKYVYYAKERGVNDPAYTNSIWRVPVEGGEEQLVIDGIHSNWCNWALAGDQLYFLNLRDGPLPRHEWAVFAKNLRTEGVSEIAAFPYQPLLYGPGFDVSSDGRWLIAAGLEAIEADLMLVEGLE